MNESTLFSLNEIKDTYEAVRDHIKTRQLIFSYSVNKDDIREVALKSLDLSVTESVLDLGCAYGFFTDKLAGRLKEGASIVGLDLIDRENRRHFLAAVNSMGYQGEFIAGNAELIKNITSGSFDLIVASYSLYFFPHLISHIARLLRPEGVFIVITHAESSLQEVIELIPPSLKAVGLAPQGEPAIGRLLRAFSLENGEKQLRPHFGSIEKIIFENDLSFPREHIEDCIDYLSKKRNLLFKEILGTDAKKEEVLSVFFRAIRENAGTEGAMMITKDDCVFRCYEPHI